MPSYCFCASIPSLVFCKKIHGLKDHGAGALDVLDEVARSRLTFFASMARVPRGFVHETLWPEFQEIPVTLHNYLSEVTERVVSEVICRDNSETDVFDDPPQLLGARDSAYSG